MGELWRSFGGTRFAPEIKSAWDTLLATIQLSETVVAEADLTLQFLLDRLMKALIVHLTAVSSSVPEPSLQPSIQNLSMRGRNAVRYMAGYVVMKLTKQFRRRSKKDQEKRAWFVAVLNTIKAENQALEGISTIEDYTTFWTEQVDRGGLYKISDKVGVLISWCF